MATKSKTANEGLVGFFGHLYEPDPECPEHMMINRQFRIVRRMDAERWAVQFLSFLTGEPTSLGVYPESTLLGETVKLYPDAESWNGAAENESRTYRARHRHESA
jgi:hypothetical protein